MKDLNLAERLRNRSVDREQVTSRFIRNYLEALNCPRSLTVWLLYANVEHDQLAALDVNPLNYNDVESFRGAYGATCFLSKADFLVTTVDKTAVAREKYEQSERKCAETNRNLLPYLPGSYIDPRELHPLIPRVQKRISKVLGSFDAEEWVDSSGWGPGVSTLMKGSQSVQPNKYQNETGITQELLDVLSPLMRVCYPSWYSEVLAQRVWDVEMGSMFHTVPKNSKTNRVIFIEPGFNLFFQKGIGKMIRDRMARKAVSLKYQSRNRSLCQSAWECALATIDFSSASDLISRSVVELLVPHEWFRVMDLVRSKRGLFRVGANTYTKSVFNKFSSMGNGFTFELESLIFWAIAHEVTADFIRRGIGNPLDVETVGAYGDDVILPQYAAEEFSFLCELLGFTVNKQKSYREGNFFESCGVHYWKGTEVTPFYLKQMVGGIRELYKAHNSVTRQSMLWGWEGLVRDGRFRPVVTDLRALIPTDLRFFGPVQFGDQVLHESPTEAARRTTRVTKSGTIVFRCIAERQQTLEFDGYGLIIDRIRNPQDQADGNLVGLKSSTYPVIGKVRCWVGEWEELGRWVN